MTHNAFETLFSLPPYSVAEDVKTPSLLEGLNQLTSHHYQNCLPYQSIIDGLWNGSVSASDIQNVPYLPVSLFKTQKLQSVSDEEIKVTLTSSGTTGQNVSKIAIDALTSNRQQRALANSLGKVLGRKRLPMLVVDSSAVFSDPKLMSARGAGVLGIMRYGRHHCFVLDEQLRPDLQSVKTFLQKHAGEPFLIFGFTFMIWLELYKNFRDEGLDLSNGILIHSGGWKKMKDQAVDPKTFRERLGSSLGLKNIYNFYGMVEQIGSIFLEGPNGLLYPPNFSDVIIRDPETWESKPIGETGVIQVLSLLPASYPGHSLLTEDLGSIEIVDPDLNGWMGKGLQVHGRVEKAELRGCSDVIGTVMS